MFVKQQVHNSNRMKWFRFIIIGLVAGTLSIFWVFPQPFHIVYAKHFSFHQLSDKIYSSEKLTKKKQRLLQKQYRIASSRISDFWGNKIGKSSVFYCSDVAIYRRLCQSPKGSGCSVITPFGSWIILNYNGMSEDVIAHEMCHDELSSRMGWWKSKTQLPKWLDEGLALQLDHRFVSSTDSIQRYIDYKAELQQFSMGDQLEIPLDNLQTEEEFFGGDPVYTQLAYLISATEVARLISVKGKNELIQKSIDGKF